MNHSDLELQLLGRLRAKGKSASALGIDLGTTKSSVACAHFDADAGTLRCECLRFPQADGSHRVAVPSAVAIDADGTTLFGAQALALRRRKGMLPDRNLFYETKNQIGLRYTYARAPKDLRTPTQIATQLLRHLRDAVNDPVARRANFPGVIGVPASFHGAQRHATVHPLATISIAGQPLQHFDIGAVSEAQHIYGLADRSNHAVDLIDIDTLRFAGRVGGLPDGGPNGLVAVDKDQFWAGGGSSKLYVIDIPSRKVIATIDTGGTKRVDELAWDPQDRLVIAVNNDDAPPFVSFVSTAAGQRIEGKLPLPQATDGAEQPAWNPTDGLVYLSIPVLDDHDADGGIAVIDPRTRRLIDTISVQQCMPAGLAIGPNDELLVGCGDDAIAAGFAPRSLIIDLHTRKIAAETRHVGGSDEVWYDPHSMRYYLAAVANRGGAALGVIDARNHKWLGNVATGAGAHSVAADPRSGKVFVPIGANKTIDGCGNGCVKVFGTH